MEIYQMLQNARVTAFTVFELLRENQLVVSYTAYPPTTTPLHPDFWFSIVAVCEIGGNVLKAFPVECMLDMIQLHRPWIDPNLHTL